MVRKQIASVFALLLVLSVGGCTAAQPGQPEDRQQTQGGPQQTEERQETENPGGFQLGGNADQVLADLNRYLDSQGMSEDYDHFRDGYICEELEQLTLYRSTLGMGWNLIVAHHKDTGKYQLVDLEDCAMYRIAGVSALPHDPDILQFHMECKLFGGDYTFKNFPAEVYYSLEAGRVVETYYNFESGAYGVIAGRDHQAIDSLQISDDEAVFTFALAEGGDGNGYDGAEVLVRTPRRYEYQTPTAIGFWYTESSLDAAALRQLREMEGVAEIRAEYMDNALFTGTVLTVTPEPYYQVDCAFSGGNDRMNELTLRCRQIKYPEPDFARELGYTLELPATVEMRQPADVYYGRRMQMALIASNETEVQFNLSRSPVDSLSALDHMDAQDLEMWEREIGGSLVRLITSNGREWSAQWEAHWYAEGYHFSLITYQEGLSLEAWSELVDDVVVGCRMRVHN